MMMSWQEYIEHHQSRQGWSDAQFGRRLGVAASTIRGWKQGQECGNYRLIVRASQLFGERWSGTEMSEMGWLLTELQEEHRVSLNFLIREGISKKSYVNLRNGSLPTFERFCKVLRAFRLPREKQQQALYRAYQIILRDYQQ